MVNRFLRTGRLYTLGTFERTIEWHWVTQESKKCVSLVGRPIYTTFAILPPLKIRLSVLPTLPTLWLKHLANTLPMYD